jgi:hypothetical protein
MTRKLILHVGRHKTGTTSLQRFLSLNDRLLLEKHSILYAATGRSNNYHHPVFRSLFEKGNYLDQRLISELKKEFDESNADTLLLSSEMLSRPGVSREKLQIIKSAFQDFSIDVIIYLRRQDDFLESAYAERVKQGICSFPQDIHSLDEILALDYYEFIKRYTSVFGEGNVGVRVFSKSRNFRIFQDFLGSIGCEWNQAMALPQKSLNIRYSWMQIETMRFANANPLTRKLAQSMIVARTFKTLSSWIPGVMDSLKPLTEEDKKEIIQRYSESNDRIAREYLGREHLFTD